MHTKYSSFVKDIVKYSINSNVEWGLQKIVGNKVLLGILRENAQSLVFATLDLGYETRGKILIDIYTHGDAVWLDFNTSGEDEYRARLIRKHSPNAKLFIFIPQLTKENYIKVKPPNYPKMMSESRKYKQY